MFYNHVTVVVGESGSGKTTIALHGARQQKRMGYCPTVIRLQIAHPFGRGPSAFAEEDLGAAVGPLDGIDIQTITDPVTLMKQLPSLILDPARRVVVDASSDKATKLVVGQCLGAVPARLIDRVMVVNFSRPFTRTPQEALAVARELEAHMGLPMTGIVGNTNLAEETTPELVLRGYQAAESLAASLGVPLIGVTTDLSNSVVIPQGQLPCGLIRLKVLRVVNGIQKKSDPIGTEAHQDKRRRPNQASKKRFKATTAGGSPCHRS